MKMMRLAIAALGALLAGCHSGGLPSSGGPDGDLNPAVAPTDMAALLHCGRTSAPPAEPFKRVQYGMVATWRGTATSPWVAPYQVEIAFAADGTYLARTTDGSGQQPFYYDKDPEHDRYEVVDLQPNGKATGNLYLEWLSSADALAQIALDDNLTHLTFEYSHFGAGPVVYDLACTP
ncbi:MAG: hypothetical protein JWN44_6075 [Myxococcales bacterium]|nr:hypothetical protein [Myxococcales bacterium]